jgi:hypothetical protein
MKTNLPVANNHVVAIKKKIIFYGMTVLKHGFTVNLPSTEADFRAFPVEHFSLEMGFPTVVGKRIPPE